VIPLALASIQGAAIVIGAFAIFATWCKWHYDLICREDERLRIRRDQAEESWDWPVKLAGPEDRERLPL
jgi:hypothetical protein